MKKLFSIIVLILTVSTYAQSNEHLVATTSYLYNNSTMTWSYSNRAIINYNDDGLRSEDFTYQWDGNSWIFSGSSQKQEYTYDLYENLYIQINSGWSDNGWNPVWRYLHVYDTESNLMQYQTQIWNGEEWRDWSQTMYGRGSEGYTAMYQSWDESNGWGNTSKSEYTYGSNGLIETRIYYGWDGNDWYITGRTTFTYDTNDNLTEEIGDSYSDGVYIPYSRQIRNYDTNNNLTLWGFQNWNATYSRWDDQYRSTYTYNEYNQHTGYLYETWGGSFWTPYSKTEYEYSTATETEETAELASNYKLFSNYPNPFNPSTNISFSLPVNSEVLLTVHNALGEKVAVLANGEKPAGEYKYTFDGSGLASGMYFYKLETDGFVEVKKMILLK